MDPSMSEWIGCEWRGCQRQFSDGEQLYDHLCEDHIGRKATNNLCLNCHWGECMASTTKRDHITSHIRRHIPFKPYPCPICNKTFKRPQDLKKHAKVHSGETGSREAISLPSPSPSTPSTIVTDTAANSPQEMEINTGSSDGGGYYSLATHRSPSLSQLDILPAVPAEAIYQPLTLDGTTAMSMDYAQAASQPMMYGHDAHDDDDDDDVPIAALVSNLSPVLVADQPATFTQPSPLSVDQFVNQMLGVTEPAALTPITPTSDGHMSSGATKRTPDVLDELLDSVKKQRIVPTYNDATIQMLDRLNTAMPTLNELPTGLKSDHDQMLLEQFLLNLVDNIDNAPPLPPPSYPAVQPTQDISKYVNLEMCSEEALSAATASPSPLLERGLPAVTSASAFTVDPATMAQLTLSAAGFNATAVTPSLLPCGGNSNSQPGNDPYSSPAGLTPTAASFGVDPTLSATLRTPSLSPRSSSTPANLSVPMHQLPTTAGQAAYLAPSPVSPFSMAAGMQGTSPGLRNDSYVPEWPAMQTGIADQALFPELVYDRSPSRSPRSFAPVTATATTTAPATSGAIRSAANIYAMYPTPNVPSLSNFTGSNELLQAANASTLAAAQMWHGRSVAGAQPLRARAASTSATPSTSVLSMSTATTATTSGATPIATMQRVTQNAPVMPVITPGQIPKTQAARMVEHRPLKIVQYQPNKKANRPMELQWQTIISQREVMAGAAGPPAAGAVGPSSSTPQPGMQHTQSLQPPTHARTASGSAISSSIASRYASTIAQALPRRASFHQGLVPDEPEPTISMRYMAEDGFVDVNVVDALTSHMGGLSVSSKGVQPTAARPAKPLPTLPTAAHKHRTERPATNEAASSSVDTRAWRSAVDSKTRQEHKQLITQLLERIGHLFEKQQQKQLSSLPGMTKPSTSTAYAVDSGEQPTQWQLCETPNRTGSTREVC